MKATYFVDFLRGGDDKPWSLATSASSFQEAYEITIDEFDEEDIKVIRIEVGLDDEE